MMVSCWKTKALLCIVVLGVGLTLGAAGCSSHLLPAAVINDQAIKRQELERFINLMRLLNPGLDLQLKEEEDDSRLRQMELEFLQILIDIELVKQETERLSLQVDPEVVRQKTEELLSEVTKTHYGASPEQFERKRKQLKLSREDLATIPLFELQLLLLFEHTASYITEEDIRLYVEENPELLRQAEAVEVYLITFADKSQAWQAQEKLRQGVALQKLIQQLQLEVPELQIAVLGWISADDPFVEDKVKKLIFTPTHPDKGGIIEREGRYELYWAGEYRPEAGLDFAEIKDEAALQMQYLLYQDYFNALWSEGRIEILHN